jgi:hypothetical protein
MTKSINKIFIVAISALLLTMTYAPSSAFAQTKDNIDQRIEKHIDVTGDGIDDDLILHITGESWSRPFNWTLIIVSKGKTIFERKSDDTWLDAFFSDKGYVNETCASYLECKKQYYLKDLINALIVKTDLSPNIHAYDKGNSGSIHFIAKKELMDEFHLSESEANKTIDWMIEKLKTKETPILYVPISPVQSEFPRMYVDRVGQFVTIYEW